MEPSRKVTAEQVKHTPGPWHLLGSWDRRLVEFRYTDAKGNSHAGNIGVIDGLHGEANEANARLITAAPEMLEALQEIAWIVGEAITVGDLKTTYGAVKVTQAYKLAKAALQKARGEK